MLRVERRLRLEPCEDRSLPAVLIPAAHPLTDSPAHVSTINSPTPLDSNEDEDAEYASAGTSASQPVSEAKGGSDLINYLRAAGIAYTVATYPPAPPMPTELVAAPALASRVPASSVGAQVAPVVVGNAPVAVPPTKQPAPAATLPERNPMEPPVEDPSHTVPTPQGGIVEEPPVPDIEVPPAGPTTFSIPFIEDLDLRLNLSAMTETATRLLDGLDTVLSPVDGEPPWIRLGYWTLAIGTVGVAVELTRQGLRAKAPDSEEGPKLPVTR
jgi:hypothetical protein